jgi:tetratricopeptide (TPR) repeat protein
MPDELERDQRRAQPLSLPTGIGNMPFGGEELLTEEAAASKREALGYFQEAYKKQMDGDFDEAVQLYRKSIAVYPTAEAHTFLGWTYSMMGMMDEAIQECHEAIEVDPAFGNPYNDIGAYLIEKGELEAAVPWLQRAMKAPRYECYFYPHFNLGRIYEARRQTFEALRQYETAVHLNPGYLLALRAFRRMQSLLN